MSFGSMMLRIWWSVHECRTSLYTLRANIAWVQGTKRHIQFDVYFNIYFCFRRWRWKSLFMAVLWESVFQWLCAASFSPSMDVCVLVLYWVHALLLKKDPVNHISKLMSTHDMKKASLAAKIYGRYMFCFEQIHPIFPTIGTKSKEIEDEVSKGAKTKLTAIQRGWVKC